MSLSLNLVIYKEKEGKLIEEGLKTVQCVEITPYLLELITDATPLKTKKIYYDNELQKGFDIQYFDNSDIDRVNIKLKKLFTEALSNGANSLSSDSLDKAPNAENTLYNILSDEPSKNTIEKSIALFYILTSVIGLFNDKQTKLSDDFSALIKVDN